METRNQIKTLSCTQVYNIWSSEPNLIGILDLRSKDLFEQAHIPGSKNITISDVSAEVRKLGQKLAVIISDPKDNNSILSALAGFDNYIIMRDCHNWLEAQKPTAGKKDIKGNYPAGIPQKGDMKNNSIFFQLFEPESSTYTYIIADPATREAAIIDPVINTVDRDLKLVDELNLKLRYVLDTHIHADHITAASEIRKRTGALTAVSQDAEVQCVDIPLEDHQELTLGNQKITALATPGHTNTCMSFYFDGKVFTGDALLIRGTGRTDFQQGSSDNLYDSIHNKLFTLPDETLVYPGHDYRGQTVSTVELEKKFNPRVGGGRSKDEFKKVMSELKLENPKKIHIAVPANLVCGEVVSDRVLRPQIVDGVPEVTCEDVFESLGKVRLIDCRRPEEFNNELGHIQHAELITLGPELTEFLEKGDRNQEIVFVCRSGGRSGTATAESIRLGYKKTVNMVGGMIRWNEIKKPIERN